MALLARELIEIGARDHGLAGQVTLGCCCALNSVVFTSSAASISFCDRNSLGVSLKTSIPRAISAP